MMVIGAESVAPLFAERLSYVNLGSLVDIVSKLDFLDWQHSQQDEISRRVLTSYLEQLVLDLELFETHFDWLARTPEILDIFGLGPADIEKMWTSGLQDFDSSVLVDLALSPDGLAQLRRRVTDEPSAAWIPAVLRLADRLESGDIDRQQKARSAPVWEKRVSQVPPLTVYEMFHRRSSQVVVSINRLESVAEEEYSRMTDELREIQQLLKSADGEEFKQLDVNLHTLILDTGGASSEEFELVQQLEEHGDPQLSAEVRADVWNEHERIVDALAERDFPQAIRHSRYHLRQSLHRWMPEVFEEIAAQNASFFTSLNADDFLCVCSINVLPLEFTTENLIDAVAEAILRGACLTYLHPSDALLEELYEQFPHDSLKMCSSSIYGGEVSDFGDRLANYLVTAHDIGMTEAVHLVDTHVAAFELDDERPFIMTRPNSTIGWYYSDGQSRMTYRDALGDAEAWMAIREDPHQPQSLNARMFCRMAADGLKESAHGARMCPRDGTIFNRLVNALDVAAGGAQKPEPLT